MKLPMRNITANFFKRSMYVAFAILINMNISFAQDVGDVGDDPDFPDIPLDGGLSILLAAGAAYGGKKLYDKNKKSDSDSTK